MAFILLSEMFLSGFFLCSLYLYGVFFWMVFYKVWSRFTRVVYCSLDCVVFYYFQCVCSWVVVIVHRSWMVAFEYSHGVSEEFVCFGGAAPSFCRHLNVVQSNPRPLGEQGESSVHFLHAYYSSIC